MSFTRTQTITLPRNTVPAQSAWKAGGGHRLGEAPVAAPVAPCRYDQAHKLHLKDGKNGSNMPCKFGVECKHPHVDLQAYVPPTPEVAREMRMIRTLKLTEAAAGRAEAGAGASIGAAHASTFAAQQSIGAANECFEAVNGVRVEMAQTQAAYTGLYVCPNLIRPIQQLGNYNPNDFE